MGNLLYGRIIARNLGTAFFLPHHFLKCGFHPVIRFSRDCA
jgi:hypothetical protein